MGLDMMLYRRDENGNATEEVMYWRKANAIHDWFVQNVQNGIDECKPHEVTVEQLKTLRDLCAHILENKEVAEPLLPTTSGFFFGSTDYNVWYFDSLSRTVVELDRLLAETNENDLYIYWSSW
jgi:hypothetical protein